MAVTGSEKIFFDGGLGPNDRDLRFVVKSKRGQPLGTAFFDVQSGIPGTSGINIQNQTLQVTVSRVHPIGNIVTFHGVNTPL